MNNVQGLRRGRLVTGVGALSVGDATSAGVEPFKSCGGAGEGAVERGKGFAAARSTNPASTVPRSSFLSRSRSRSFLFTFFFAFFSVTLLGRVSFPLIDGASSRACGVL